MARKTAATARPAQSPGWPKKWCGISVLMKSAFRDIVISGSGGPISRTFSKERKYVVLKAIFSTPQITKGGKTAHINGARGAVAETRSSQAYRGAYQSP